MRISCRKRCGSTRVIQFELSDHKTSGRIKVIGVGAAGAAATRSSTMSLAEIMGG